ncbi:cytochrome P450 [Deinococcus actinosclerus]|uniref:Cytochrome P450 n=1 Tax=Deinococcus actinosclerus TaxID=1768108 RepID=A0ABM5X453_9DEIO|nr:cytochrome P450 [Deinococcus actinosclerus]ALW88464.1 cytochrome P450 [Deinococcus actinosclerus]
MTDALPLPSSPRVIPTVPGPPVIGSVTQLFPHRLRAFLTGAYREHGPVFNVTGLGRTFTVLAGPEANVWAMKESSRVLRSLEAWRPNDQAFGVQRSLISVDGPEHRAFRRVEGRTYTRSYLGANLRRALSVVAEDLAPLRAGDDLPVAAFCKAVITEQLARVVVNGAARPYLNDLLTFVQTTLMVRVTGQRPRLTETLPGFRRARARSLAMVETLIDEHRRATPEQAGREPDLIDDLLTAQAADPAFWSDLDLRMAAIGAFIAGMDTAANTLAFVLYRVGRHPELVPALIAEADEAFRDGPPSMEALGRLPHLHRFVLECLRLHPIAPALTRTVTQDFEFAGYRVPQGRQVIVGTTVPHGLDECFPDAGTFDPGRFAPGRMEHRRPGAFAPFGLGTHICAGSGMAEGLILLNLAAILRTLDLRGDPAYVLREVARPTATPDDRLTLRVAGVRHPAVSLLA